MEVNNQHIDSPNNESSPEDFKIYDDIADLPLHENPTYLNEGINGICTGGSAILNVASNQRKITKNDLVVLFPYHLVSITEVSDDFSMLFYKVPKTMFMDTMSGLCRLTLDLFFYMRQNFSYPLDDNERERFAHFCHLLSFRASSSPNLFRKESIMHLLRVFYWDIYIAFKNSAPATEQSIKYTSKEKITFNFFYLVTEHHSESREVAFYAKKLSISPKYLTLLMKEVTGQTAKDWIIEYTILELKSLLRNTQLDIKEIVKRTNFPSQSVMSRFFREYTGMTPSEYRNSIS
ncbi:helix-turn-helix domain-containing protein [Bacteroides sp. OM05-12]|mgnify:FL=1|jgi:AraC-like DNA-binding protein|uniref:helix-turn-helix domain-containing protein n=1 Tax=Bacteroides sp. OM05-12 TaxID=2292283 RepID=UPI000E9DC338|nr:helix-turn-helix domain-containing protein [Bacteroides sp. OM05-12]RGN45369.1 AraC family transcriptional regulator [Bacteroides sp. OM05-12]